MRAAGWLVGVGWAAGCAPPCEPESGVEPREFELTAAERADLEATALDDAGAFSCVVACADAIGIPEDEIVACELVADGDAGTLRCDVAYETFCD